jgi:Rieske Fe-S protein
MTPVIPPDRPATCPSRRHLLQAGGLVGALAAVTGCGPRPGGDGATDADGATRFPLADTAVGESTYYSGPRIVVTRPAEDQVRAFDATCPHQGCATSGTGPDGELVCPCHGSVFDPDTGDVIAGPAETGLASLAAELDGQDVVVRD